MIGDWLHGVVLEFTSDLALWIAAQLRSPRRGVVQDGTAHVKSPSA
jgi:hypothetical protein